LRERATIRTLGITGNGSRVPGLIERVVTASSLSVDVPTHAAEDDYPCGASFAFDYALAASLATWALD
jgi:hypothetical protein